MAEIVIGGDVCPINRNADPFVRGDAPAIFNDLLPEFEAAHLTLVNLECPLIDRPEPIAKVGPVLGAEPGAVNGLRSAGIGVVNLANNHILDHGQGGLKSTMAACTSAGITVFGAGENLQQAGKGLIREVDGIRVAFLAYAEREFSVAGRETPGANPLSLTDFARRARLVASQSDYLVVLLHAGVQHFPYPSPRLQDTCRFMIEEGAGAVICQHSHCAGCWETYGAGHIVYGQGNLVFDRYPGRSDTFYTGFLVRLSISKELKSGIEVIPYRQSDRLPGARRMEAAEERLFLASLNEKNRQVTDAEFVDRQWTELCRKKKYDFFSTLSGHGRLLRYINRKAHLSDILYTRQSIVNLRNIVTCESHNEMLERILTL